MSSRRNLNNGDCYNNLGFDNSTSNEDIAQGGFGDDDSYIIGIDDLDSPEVDSVCQVMFHKKYT